MNHRTQLELALYPELIKEAFIGRLGGAFGKGLVQSGKRFASTLGRARGYANQGLGKMTGNASRATRGAQQVTSNSRPSVAGAWHSPRATGQRLSNFWGAKANGVRGAGEHAAYAAGRLPAMMTYGGALGFLPYTIGDYAGSAAGAKAALPNLQNHVYDEATGFLQDWENKGFLDRMGAAFNPQGFGNEMLNTGNPLDHYSQNAYQRMFDPSFQNQTNVGVAKELFNRSTPLGLFMPPQSFDESRNFIQRRAAREMADRGASFFQPKSAFAMNNTEMLKSAAAIAGRGLMTLAKPMAQKTPGMFGRFMRKAWMPAAGAAMLGHGYMGSRNSTEQDLYGQARGTARAGMAQYWNSMNPMQRFGAALFPTATRMRAESAMGPGYRDFYNQYYGQPQ